MIGRIVLPWMVAGLLLLGGIVMFQDRFLYFPEQLALPTLLEEAQQQGLRRWPAEGEFRGLVGEPEGPVRGTLVLFHGNAGHAGHRTHYSDLTRLGLRVILAEYPGYGPRPGKPGEDALATDAAETLLLAYRQFGNPVLLAGESLGSSVAAAAYARAPQVVAAVWLITPWDSLVNVARHHYPWLPVGWLLRDRYDSLSHLSAAQIPVAVVVAERDTVVPAHFGLRLYEQLSAPKRLWQVPGAGHNDWIGYVGEREWPDMVDFLVEAPRSRSEEGASDNPSPSILK